MSLPTARHSGESSRRASFTSGPQALGMSPTRRELLKWLGSVGCGLMLSGCNREATPADAALAPTVSDQASAGATPLRVAMTVAPREVDPARMTRIEEYNLAYALYDALLYFDEELTVQPLLAESWQADATLTEWTFALRSGVTFHNGAPLTAADVVYTFQRLAGIGDFDSARAAASDDEASVLRPQAIDSPFRASLHLQAVEALDAYTVRFLLSAPNADFPFIVASPQASILSSQVTPAAQEAQPVGTGPFRFVENIPADRIRLARNSEYWEPEAIAVQELELVYIPSFEAQTDALRHNQIHLVPDINLLNLAMLREDPNIEIHRAMSGRYQYIVMQVTEPPFTDLRVRQALKLCIDRVELQQKVLQNLGAIGSDHPVAPNSPFRADLPIPARDIAQARRLLADAGYPNGLTLSLITSDIRPGMVLLAQAMRDMAAPAGVSIEVIQVPPDVYETEYVGRVPFYVSDWMFRPSIDETFTIPFHSQSPHNGSKWQNADFDALIETARGEGNVERRQALYAEAQRILMEDGAVVIPYFAEVMMASHGVQNLICLPTGYIDFFGVTLG